MAGIRMLVVCTLSVCCVLALQFVATNYEYTSNWLYYLTPTFKGPEEDESNHSSRVVIQGIKGRVLVYQNSKAKSIFEGRLEEDQSNHSSLGHLENQSDHSSKVVPQGIKDSFLVYRNSKANGSHFIDVFFQGRLGNLMFEYAASYCIARSNGFVPLLYEKAKIRQSFEQLDCHFSHSLMPEGRFQHFVEKAGMMYDNMTERLGEYNSDVHLLGFFQSWKYCRAYRREIQEQFTFMSSVQFKTDAFMKSIREIYAMSTFNIGLTGSLTYIGVHIRRGDFLAPARQLMGRIVVDVGYIRRAMDYFTKQFSHIVFVVCTDDTSWAKDNLKFGNKSIIFSPFSDPAEDLCLLSKCNHTIMTTGTFSWWGAWLAGGQAVYLGAFPDPESPLGKNCNREDYYMSHWVAL